MSESSCWEIIKNKKCNVKGVDYDLKCKDLTCSFQQEPTEKFSWWETNTGSSYKCLTIQRVIDAETKDSLVFNHLCRVTDKQCRLPNSIVVWNIENLMDCPFTRVSNKITFEFDETGTFESEENHLLFKFSQFSRHCKDVMMMRTTEGLYLSYQRLVLLTVDDTARPKDSKALTELILADRDFETDITIIKIHELAQIECTIFRNSLTFISFAHNKYVKIKDYKGNDIIIYSNFGNIYRPMCVDVDKFTIANQSTNCYEHVPVSFRLQSKTINGFLTQNGIIQQTSNSIACNNIKQFIRISKDISIIRTDNKYLVIENSTELYRIINFVSIHIQHEVRHNDIMKEGVDYQSQIIKYVEAKEPDGSWYVDNRSEDIKISGLDNIGAYFGEKWGAVKYVLASGILGLKIIMALIAIISIISCCCYCSNCYSKRKVNQYKELIHTPRYNNKQMELTLLDRNRSPSRSSITFPK